MDRKPEEFNTEGAEDTECTEKRGEMAGEGEC